jgi:hypothetical protein
MAKYQNETSTYKNFSMLCEKIITINEQICAMRPIQIIEDENDLLPKPIGIAAG